MRFYLEHEPYRSMSDEEQRAIYQANREALLYTECFWRFEPGIPDELRAIPAQPDPRFPIPVVPAYDGSVFRDELLAFDQWRERRRQWLQEHPPT
jgi:hypothetical protein